MHHRPRCRNESRLADVVTLFLVLDGVENEVDHLFVTRAPRHQASQVVLADREQAGTNLAIGGDANAAAMPAKRMRNRSDNADLAYAVFKDIATGGLAVRLADFAQRMFLLDRRAESGDVLERVLYNAILHGIHT